MNDPLPPLNALRAFEAAARHLSFKEAAAELRVTNGAVSLQIKLLEETLGLRLFDRRIRSVALTGDGQRYFRAVRAAFRLIKEATQEVRTARGGIVTMSCTSSFALRWLLPRLTRLRERAPALDLRISTTDQLVDFARDGIDLAVRHGLGRYAGLKSERLLDDALIAVCSPALLNDRPALAGPDALRDFELLHGAHRDDWRLWLVAMGATEVDWSRGAILADDDAVIAAAAAGKGVALVRESMVPAELGDGRLVRAITGGARIDFAYYLVYPSRALSRVDVVTVRRWLCDEAALRRES